MKKLTAVYKNSNIVIRTKAPQLFLVLAIIAGLMPIIIINDLVVGDYLNAALELLIVVVMLVSIAMLYRGNYRFASVTPLVAATLAMTAIAATRSAQTPVDIYALTLIILPALFLSLVMGESERYTLAVAAAGVPTILLVSLLIIAPRVREATGEPIGEPLMVSMVIYVLCAFFTFIVARSERLSLESVESANIRGMATIKSISALMKEAEANLSSARTVAEDYQSAAENVELINEQVSVFEHGTADLRQNIAKALQAVRHTADRVLEFHQQVDEQNTVVLETTAAVNEMSASLDSVAQITAAKRAAAERLQQVAEAGRKSLESTEAAFKAATSQMRSLLEINSIIADIASRTNLLSMNAAIEAAHAGDRGRGFAVVADEIRKLAQSTGENSQTISDNLKRIMNSISVTNSHVANAAGSMLDISREVMEVAQAFQEISHSTSELSQGGREVMNAMQALQNSSMRVRDGSDEIAGDQQNARSEMDRVGAVVENIERASRQVVQSSDVIRRSMEHLSLTIGESREISDRLQRSIASLTNE